MGNLPQYALRLDVVRQARPDDGLLDLLIMPCKNQLGLMGHSLRTLLGRHLTHHSVIYKRLRQVRVEASSPVPVQIDGDEAGFLPLEMSIQPGHLLVKVPPEHFKR